MPKDPIKLSEIRAGYGLVIYNSQLVEQQLIFMIFAAKLDQKHQMKKIDYRDLFGNCFNHTVDKLKHDLRDQYHLSSPEIEYINRFLKLRNVFSFKYFGKRTKELYSDDGQEKMIKELESASLILNQTNHLLKEKLDNYLKERKIFKEHITRLVERANTMENLAKVNPKKSFPTLVFGEDNVVVGFKPDEIRTALDKRDKA